MLSTKLAHFRFPYRWSSMHKTALCISYGFDLICSSIHNILFTHPEIDTTILFQQLWQSSFRICWSKQRRITTRTFLRSCRCLGSWNLLKFFQHLLFTLILHFHSTEIIVMQSLFRCYSLSGSFFQHQSK